MYMKKVLDRFEELAQFNKHAFDNDGLQKKAVISPIEFIAIAFLIDQYGATKSNAELEVAIRNMRRKVRAVHDDEVLRKPKVWDTLMESIRGSLGPIEPQERPLTPESGREAVSPDIPFPADNGGTKRPLPEDDEAEQKSDVRRRFIAQLHEAAIEEERY